MANIQFPIIAHDLQKSSFQVLSNYFFLMLPIPTEPW